jgi:phospholipase/carboxylesterase
MEETCMASPGASDVNAHTETLGRLNCQIVDSLPIGKSPDYIVVLCHGYGAPGTDLVPFGPELLEHSPTLSERFQFLFPEAPLDLEERGMPGGRAWWHLDMRRLQLAAMSGQIRDLCADRPEGLASSRERLLELIGLWSRQTGVPLSRFVLGGFSQGSMLATDVALHLDENPAGLIVLSGTLLNESEWRELAPRRKGLCVLQSHGDDDPLLPFAGAEALRDMLSGAGAVVEFVPFRGGHGIPLPVFDAVALMLERLAASAS